MSDFFGSIKNMISPSATKNPEEIFAEAADQSSGAPPPPVYSAHPDDSWDDVQSPTDSHTGDNKALTVENPMFELKDENDDIQMRDPALGKVWEAKAKAKTDTCIEVPAEISHQEKTGDLVLLEQPKESKPEGESRETNLDSFLEVSIEDANKSTENLTKAEDWRFGPCDCLGYPLWCVVACFMPDVTFALAADRIQHVKVALRKMLLTGLLILLLVLVQSICIPIASGTATLWIGILSIVVSLGWCFLVAVRLYHDCRLRTLIRERYGIQGSTPKDALYTVLLALCCCGLHQCQMFNEVNSRERTEVV